MHACVLPGRLDAGLGVPRFHGLRVDVEAACTGERRNVDGGRFRFYEGLRGGASRGTRCENVVDEQNVLARNDGWIGNLEGAADVVAALSGRESSLTFRGAQAHERGGRESESPLGMRFVQCINRALCKRSGLVEAALFLLCPVQRYGNDEQFCRRIG